MFHRHRIFRRHANDWDLYSTRCRTDFEPLFLAL